MSLTDYNKLREILGKVAVTLQEIWRNIAIILGMLILVYGIYFIATDVQFDRNINGSR